MTQKKYSPTLHHPCVHTRTQGAHRGHRPCIWEPCRQPSRSQPHVVSLSLSVSFVNVVCALPERCLRISSRCLRTSIPHWHSALTHLIDTAYWQLTHAVRCRIIGIIRIIRRWKTTCTRCALPYHCLHTPFLLLVTLHTSSPLSKKIRSIRVFWVLVLVFNLFPRLNPFVSFS